MTDKYNFSNNSKNNYKNQPNYSFTEQIYESADKSIRIFKSRKKFTIMYIAVKQYYKKHHEKTYNYEYTILKDISHPNIVKICGYTEDSNYFNMEMEYCITQDLSKAIWHNRSSQYPEKIVKSVGTQIMLALRHLHKMNILHCNLKPSNILVDDYGNIRLCDFKKALNVNKLNINEIKKNKSAMTPCYTAPELFSENGIYDYKTDIWAMGCIIYELATGQVPFFDESVNKLMNKIINDGINFYRKELDKFSDHFISLIKGLLEKDSEKRLGWNEIEKHPFWEKFGNELEQKTANNSKSNNNSSKSIPLISKKKTNDILDSNKNDINTLVNKDIISKNKDAMLSNNIVKNNIDDNYERIEEENVYQEKGIEVGVPDQEFNFEAKKLEETENECTNDINLNNNNNNYYHNNKNENPLKISLLNVSSSTKKKKNANKKNNIFDELNQSIADFKNLLNNNLNNIEDNIKENSNSIPIENLLLHQSDKIIKPIIGNRLIEVLPPTNYNKNYLPFSPWKIEKIKDLIKTNNFKDIENYLYQVYEAMIKFYSSEGEENNLLNVLNYFETIIQDKEISNKIINTSFFSLFISMLKSSIPNYTKSNNYISPSIQAVNIRICTILAYLIRYSTMIENPLEEENLCEVLENIILNTTYNIKNIEVSKRAIATLGEYLFFFATQAEGEEDNSSMWTISNNSLSVLLWALDKNKDETIKFYAIKAIENISALTSIAQIYFCNDAFIKAILEIYLDSKLHDMRISAIYTASHLIRLNNSLFAVFIKIIPLNTYTNRFNSEDLKLRQGLLNCLIFGSRHIFKHCDNNRNISDDKKKITSIGAFLLENIGSFSPILKVKIILLLCFTINDINSILFFNELNLLSILIKLKKDPNQEIQQSINYLELYISSSLIEVIKNLRIYIINNSNNNVNSKDVYYKELLNSCNKLEDIKEFIDIFKELENKKVDYLNFYDKLVKTGELIYKEKVWNLFKDLSLYDNSKFVLANSLINFLNENSINYNKEYFNNRDKLSFDEFLSFFVNGNIEFN